MDSIKIDFQEGFYPKTKNGTNPEPEFTVSIDARVFHQPIMLDNWGFSTGMSIKYHNFPQLRKVYGRESTKVRNLSA
ncbi:MAG: hypothetical protein D9V45_08350 [Chloroflexi bacterium]|nr:MAG: hypothetical protein D9V45_08350 [Chloroflexota bacterium]